MIRIVRVLITTFAFLWVSGNAYGQRLVNTSGNTLTDNSSIFEYSLGEISITTLSDARNSNYITQGLLQPKVKLINPACAVVNDTISYFPNPTPDILRVVTNPDWITSYRIYAADGKLLRIAAFVNNQINMYNLPAGVYFIKFYPGCEEKYRTLKVIKK